MSGADRCRRRGRRSSAGSLLAPLLPGLVQHWKARLQGRRGPSPLQPYRELRRLWGKSARRRRGHDRRLPARAGGRRGERSPPRCCSSRSPAARPAWGVGHDALVLVGLLALARFALAARGVGRRATASR